MMASGESTRVGRAPYAARVALVGRRDELSRIERALADVRLRSDRHAVVVEAAAGFGKSTLIDEFVRRLRPGLRVVRAAPIELELDTSWSTLRAVTDGWRADALAPPLAVATGRADGPAAPQSADVVFGWIDSLRHLAVPVDVAVIDDAHWCDRSSAAALAASMREVPVFWVFGTRPGQLAIDVERLLADDERTLVDLGAMPADDLAELVVTTVARRLPPRRIDEIVELAAGSPLLAVELARAERDGVPVRADRGSSSTLYRERFDGLGTDARTLVGLAALAARPTLELIAPDLAPVRLRDALDEAERAGFLRLDGGGVVFSHPIARQEASDALRSVERVMLHATLAERIDDPDRRAVHLGHAALRPDAAVADELEAAARAASQRGAGQDALDLFVRAMQLTPAGEQAARWRRRVGAGIAAASISDYERADELLAGLLDSDQDEELVAAAAGSLMAVADRLRGNRAAADTARSILERLPSGAERARTWRVLVRINQHDDLRLAERVAEDALADVRSTGDERDVLAAEITYASVEFLRGRAVAIDELIDRTSAYPGEGGLVSAASFVQELLAWDDRFDACRVLLDELEAGARRSGSYIQLAELLSQRATVEFRAGSIALAEKLAHEAVAIMRPPRGSARFLTAEVMLSILGLRGDRHGATEIIASVQPEIDVLPRSARILFAAHAGFAELSLGDDRAAADHLARAASVAAEYGMDDARGLGWQGDLADALVRVGDLETASEVVRGMGVIAERCGSTVVAVDHLRSLGALRLAQGDVAAATELLADAALQAPRTGRPLVVARGLLALGSAHRRGGRRRQAREVLLEARRTFALLDAVPWTERTDDELRRAGHRVGPTSRPGELTPTEQQVADLAAHGRSNREIAAELLVSVRTVESNLTRIYRKLGVRSRTELAARGPQS